jgi:hypothetical protein
MQLLRAANQADSFASEAKETFNEQIKSLTQPYPGRD